MFAGLGKYNGEYASNQAHKIILRLRLLKWRRGPKPNEVVVTLQGGQALTMRPQTVLCFRPHSLSQPIHFAELAMVCRPKPTLADLFWLTFLTNSRELPVV